MKNKRIPKKWKVPRKSIEKGNATIMSRPKYGFGDVFVVSKKKPDRKKHWYLYYPDRKWHTGGFSSKKKAIAWYENGGR